MKRATLYAAAAALVVAVLPALAQADMYCPDQISLFGTVSNVNGREFTLKSERSDLGYIHVDYDRTRVRSHGLSLQRGTFVGVYGCLREGGRLFSADEVTLANSPNDYAGYPRRTVSFSGRITRAADGRVLLASTDGHGDVWVYTSTAVRVGQEVQVTGSFDPTNSAFVASNVSVRP